MKKHDYATDKELTDKQQGQIVLDIVLTNSNPAKENKKERSTVFDLMAFCCYEISHDRMRFNRGIVRVKRRLNNALPGVRENH